MQLLLRNSWKIGALPNRYEAYGQAKALGPWICLLK